MSVVACKITENGFELASDSITARGYTQSKGRNVSHSKLFEVNDMIIGGVGYARETALLRLFSASRRPARTDELAILEFLSEFVDWKNKKISNAKLENDYFIGFGGKVFTSGSWFVSEVLTYQAIGAGKDFALAAMYLGHSAEQAVETAIELSIYCESPIIKFSYERPKTKKK